MNDIVYTFMFSSEQCFDDEINSEAVDSFVNYGERIARLIAGLEAHQRFWYYLALFELGGYRVCR